MTAITKRRGRPVGSGKNDEATLMGVARAMVRDPLLKPTTAMKRVIGSRGARLETNETLTRRLQVKWRAQGTEFLIRARRELEAKPTTLRDLLVEFGMQNPTIARIDAQLNQTVEMISKMENPIKRFINSPEVRAAAELLAELDKLMKRIRAVQPVVAQVPKLPSVPHLPKLSAVPYVPKLPNVPHVREQFSVQLDAYQGAGKTEETTKAFIAWIKDS